ncbi:response regulator [Pseudomarimonas salicorniae]|uniref:Response regulator n=1 Tax=Pseudomarimonas salicorniae TaxID=2933270 RepID=A0ABT0GFD2_9GAMM|nr:response regulator [Lysobacter sp. CAU 1642]MCK7593256.1 response regulator [Lysobacter sp. CAU 1642]
MRNWPWPDEPLLVLAVDDQEPNLRLLGRLLAEAGIDIMPAGNGQTALSRLQALRPDLVLLDLRMPGMDGREVLKAIRARGEWDDMPVILCTAAHEKPALLQALSEGADDFLLKPYEAEELLFRVMAQGELSRRRRLAAEAAQA